jgi:hypothetical protein
MIVSALAKLEFLVYFRECEEVDVVEGIWVLF